MVVAIALGVVGCGAGVDQSRSTTTHSRLVQVPGVGLLPRKQMTLVRYPTAGSPARTDVVGAPPERAAGPFPLLVFGHGFAVTPAIYVLLLRAWARAGYIVVAPLFPLENANAPGGPNESDLVNQPRDMSFVISRMLAASADSHSVFAGLINQRAIAVAGQSDGGRPRSRWPTTARSSIAGFAPR